MLMKTCAVRRSPCLHGLQIKLRMYSTVYVVMMREIMTAYEKLFHKSTTLLSKIIVGGLEEQNQRNKNHRVS